MRVLAFDTALFGCSAALLDTESGAVSSAQLSMARGQSEALVPMLQEVVAEAGRTFHDIDLVATTIGPGAFTGLRISIATARGLGLALGRPVGGVVTLDALAGKFFSENGLEPGEILAVLIETKRTDYYCGFYDEGGKILMPPAALSHDEVLVQAKTLAAAGRGNTGTVYIGDALGRFDVAGAGSRPLASYELPDPAVVARMAYDDWSRGDLRSAAPLYLRGADVSQAKNPARTIRGGDSDDCA